jgi:hypothetical protein
MSHVNFKHFSKTQLINWFHLCVSNIFMNKTRSHMLYNFLKKIFFIFYLLSRCASNELPTQAIFPLDAGLDLRCGIDLPAARAPLRAEPELVGPHRLLRPVHHRENPHARLPGFVPPQQPANKLSFESRRWRWGVNHAGASHGRISREAGGSGAGDDVVGLGLGRGDMLMLFDGPRRGRLVPLSHWRPLPPHAGLLSAASLPSVASRYHSAASLCRSSRLLRRANPCRRPLHSPWRVASGWQRARGCGSCALPRSRRECSIEKQGEVVTADDFFNQESCC